MSINKDEILQKLRDAGIKNYFTLTLKLNGSIVEEIDFSADKFHTDTLLETRTYFLMTDLKKKVLEVYSEKEKEVQEKIKNEQVKNLWKDFEKGE